MAETGQRRSWKRVAIAFAIVTLLLSGYVSSYGVACWMNGRWAVSKKPGLDSVGFDRLHNTVFVPIIWCTRVPGGRVFVDFGTWCFVRGAGSSETWNDVRRQPARWEWGR